MAVFIIAYTIKHNLVPNSNIYERNKIAAGNEACIAILTASSTVPYIKNKYYSNTLHH